MPTFVSGGDLACAENTDDPHGLDNVVMPSSLLADRCRVLHVQLNCYMDGLAAVTPQGMDGNAAAAELIVTHGYGAAVS